MTRKTRTPALEEPVAEAALQLLDAIILGVIQRNAEPLAALLAAPLADARKPAAYSRVDAAEYIAVSPATLDRMRQQGKIKSTTAGGPRRYRKAELDKFLASEEGKG